VELKNYDLASISNTLIDAKFKGFPLNAHGLTIAEFLSKKPNLFTSDFQFPIMALRKSALDHNVLRMANYCKSHNVDLAPHVKTPMSPQIAKQQLDAGAWGITVANFNQANIFLDYGFKRIIIGNEVLEPSTIRKIATLNYSGFAQIIFYIDSISALNIVKESIRNQTDSKINIFIEIGAFDGRAGIRDLGLLPELLAAIKSEERIEVLGVSGFEGAVPGGDRDAGVDEIRKFLQRIVKAAEIVAPHVPGKVIISGGGSSYFDYVTEEFLKYNGDAQIILRSGGYVSHDHIHYEDLYPFMHESRENRFEPALEIWSRVLSIPEPTLGILNFGKRDAGNDLDNPLPIKKYSEGIVGFQARIEKLNDQHAFMRISQNSAKIGQIIGCGISHPCTNFDKWRLIPVVTDDYDVVDCIQTFF
jgi:D-serine dehydratase